MEEKSLSISKCLKNYNFPLNANAINLLLIKAGVIEEISYESSASGRIKTFKKLLPEYIEYGENVESNFSESTSLHFYPSKFKEILLVVVNQLALEIENIEA